jgi:hypothetical protein
MTPAQRSFAPVQTAPAATLWGQEPCCVENPPNQRPTSQSNRCSLDEVQGASEGLRDLVRVVAEAAQGLGEILAEFAGREVGLLVVDVGGGTFSAC